MSIRISVLDTLTGQSQVIEAESMVLNTVDKEGSMGLHIKDLNYDQIAKAYQDSIDYLAKAINSGEIKVTNVETEIVEAEIVEETEVI